MTADPYDLEIELRQRYAARDEAYDAHAAQVASLPPRLRLLAGKVLLENDSSYLSRAEWDALFAHADAFKATEAALTTAQMAVKEVEVRRRDLAIKSARQAQADETQRRRDEAKRRQDEAARAARQEAADRDRAARVAAFASSDADPVELLERLRRAEVETNNAIDLAGLALFKIMGRS